MFVHRMTQIRSAPQSMQARFAVKPCPFGTPEIPCKTIACMSNAEIHGKRLAHPPTMASLLQHHHLHPLGIMCLGARRDRQTDKPDKRCRKCQQEKKRIMGSRLIIAWMNHNAKPKNDIFGALLTAARILLNPMPGSPSAPYSIQRSSASMPAIRITDIPSR